MHTEVGGEGENFYIVVNVALFCFCLSLGETYQVRMGPNSNTKTHKLDALDAFFKRFWKEEEMQHHGKHAPVPPILRPVAFYLRV